MSLEDVERLAAAVGLDIVKREMHDSVYTTDLRSMGHTFYRSVLLVAVKRQ